MEGLQPERVFHTLGLFPLLYLNKGTKLDDRYILEFSLQ